MNKIINIFNKKPNGMMICHFDNIKNRYIVIIEPITEEQEERIDKSKLYYGQLHYEKDDIIVEGRNIIMYGEINIKDKDDIDLINHFNLINVDGSWIYSNFDYKKGIAVINDDKTFTYPTYNALEWFKYCYCMIGKPKRIIVYKYNNKNKNKK